MEKQIDDELTLNQPVWGRKWFFASINPENLFILSILIQTIGGRRGGIRWIPMKIGIEI